VIALKAPLYTIVFVALSLVPAQCEPLCILIDAGHGGYPLEDGRLSAFCHLASELGFCVEVEDIGMVNLQEYCLILSANPDTAFSQKECDLLKTYLAEGGILFVMGAGDYENRDHSDITNSLLEALESHIRFNDDQLRDTINSGKSYIPIFDNWRPHPLTGPLPPISLYSPESVVVSEGAYPLLLGNPTTKSEDTDGNILTEYEGELLTLLAAERIGKGDLFVGGSWGFVSGLTFLGHREFAEQLLWYASGGRMTISSYKEVFQGASIIIGKECRPEVDRKGAEVLAALLHGEICSEKSETTVIIGGPEVNPLFEEINPYLPLQFEKDQNWYITREGQPFHGQEYGIIALVVIGDHRFLVVAGLGGTGTAGGVNLLQQIEKHSLVLTYNAYGEAVLFSVSGDANFNGSEEDSELWEIHIL